MFAWLHEIAHSQEAAVLITNLAFQQAAFNVARK